MKINTYKKFKENITKQNLLPKDNGLIILTLSGGVDSVVLFHLFLKLQSEFSGQFELVSHHQNHMIRESSAQDLELSRQISESHDVPFYSSVDNVPSIAQEKSLNLEDAGRRVRQKNWLALAKALRDDLTNVRIATAHHANDQAETLLLNLARGSSLKGLSAIEAQQGMYIRPLLNITKTELYEYAEANDLNWIEDESNYTSDYRRNYLRNELIPAWAEHFDQGLVERIGGTASKLADIDSYLDDLLEDLSEKLRIELSPDFYNAAYTYYDLDEFLTVDKRLHLSLLGYILKKEGLEKDIFTVHLENIYEVILEKKGEKSLDLPHDYTFTKNREFFYIYQNDYQEIELSADIEEFKMLDLLDDKEISLSEELNIKLLDDNEIFSLAINSDVLADLSIRNFKTGDYFYDANGSKVWLKDFFATNNVRLGLRSKIILICKDSEVLSVSNRIINNKLLFPSDRIDILVSDYNVPKVHKSLWYNSLEKVDFT